MTRRRARVALAATLSAGAGIALLLLIAAPLFANGGTVRLARAAAGAYLVSAYSSPVPLRTGEVDISVLVQDTTAREAVVDVTVLVEAVPVDFDADPVRHGATREQATNKLFKAAKFPIVHEGEWEFRIHAGAEEGGVAAFRVALADATLLDRPYLLALMVLLPLAFVAWLFAGKGDEDEGPDGGGPDRSRQSRMAATM